MAKGHSDPDVIRKWVEYRLQHDPSVGWTSWDILIWLERNGYDVWVVVDVPNTDSGYFHGHSPEHVISRWMTEIRLGGETVAGQCIIDTDTGWCQTHSRYEG